MSHFTVLVVGLNRDEQLARFHEFESTGVDEFVQDLDITGEAEVEWRRQGSTLSFREWVQDYYGHPLLDTDHPLDLAKAHKYGYVRVENPGTPSEKVTVIHRTNPNAKWDWYVLGGRWRGFFKLKRTGTQGELGEPGVFNNDPTFDVDMALKGDIDFEGMRKAAGEEAGACWDRYVDLVCPPVYGHRPWSDFMGDESLGDMQARRAAYWAQTNPALLDTARTRTGLPIEDRRFLAWANPDDYNVQREEFVRRAEDSTCLTHAILKDGVWYERGEMGAFASVSGEVPEEAWAKTFWDIVNALPDDTLLSIYDCHI